MIQARQVCLKSVRLRQARSISKLLFQPEWDRAQVSLKCWIWNVISSYKFFWSQTTGLAILTAACAVAHGSELWRYPANVIIYETWLPRSIANWLAPKLATFLTSILTFSIQRLWWFDSAFLFIILNLCMFVCILSTAFYVLPFGVINDDDEKKL